MEGNWRERREEGKSMHDLVGLGWVGFIINMDFLQYAIKKSVWENVVFWVHVPWM